MWPRFSLRCLKAFFSVFFEDKHLKGLSFTSQALICSTERKTWACQVVKLKGTTSEFSKGSKFARKARNLLNVKFCNKSNIALQLALPTAQSFSRHTFIFPRHTFIFPPHTFIAHRTKQPKNVLSVFVSI